MNHGKNDFGLFIGVPQETAVGCHSIIVWKQCRTKQYKEVRKRLTKLSISI
jgi:hypothetical protein